MQSPTRKTFSFTCYRFSISFPFTGGTSMAVFSFPIVMVTLVVLVSSRWDRGRIGIKLGTKHVI